MLYKIDTLIGGDIVSEGGKIGTVSDVLFDDREWVIRYLVVDTGDWLSSRKTLISPRSLLKPKFDESVFPVKLTRKQIENSPPISADEPVSRQHEIEFLGYYGLDPYFITTARGPVGEPPVPLTEETPSKLEENDKTAVKEPDPHLRSAKHVTGYHIQATDEEIGHVEDFFVDDESWTVRYMVIDTRNWLPGKKVVLAKDWIEKVSWEESKVFVSVARETVKNSPEYIPSSPLTREYEIQLYKYYQRPTYWE
jgi:uncharacterized protein YrrD